MLHLIICGDYRFSFSPEIHSTQSDDIIATKIDAQPGTLNAILRLDMGQTIGQEQIGFIREPFGASYAN